MFDQVKYILGIDQSTQGTKALLFDNNIRLIARCDVAHKQHITKEGWVSHDLNEIYQNTIQAVKKVVDEAGIDRGKIMGVGISNQRETTASWDRRTGEPLDYAIVWQCARATNICDRIAQQGYGDKIKEYTGMPLSPFFPASKMKWLLENNVDIRKKQENLCFGTIDSWLVFKLTGGVFKTDYSNASRTQLFNINTLQWDPELCSIFDVPVESLAKVSDSDDFFGETDFEGFLTKKIPIHSVMGDSHAALYGQGCVRKGMMKSTYGTGSSIMMNIGQKPLASKHGVVTSLAWSTHGQIHYVLEGNINYAGAVITWMKDDLGLIHHPQETDDLAMKSNPEDKTYLVPAFSGLGAPHWKTEVRGMICGLSRFTGKAEMVRAGLDCIAFQVNDIIKAMEEDANSAITELRVDGGITKNEYLMQFQSDIADVAVFVSQVEELSALGVVMMVGSAIGLYPETIHEQISYKVYNPKMPEDSRKEKIIGWNHAVCSVIGK